MIISCTSCNTMLRIDSSLVKVDGSKVRCAKCNDIIMVYPPKNNTESRIQRRNNNTEMAASNIGSEVPDNHPIENIEPTDDLEQVAEDGDIEYAELPELSEIEEIVDSILDERDHFKNISPYIQAKYSLTQNLDFGRV